jgi:divalent metal cation (Fe/Co/Zn/Cd) transporter
VGIALHQITGNAVFDGAGSIAIGLLLAGVAFGLGRDTKDMLIGEAALPEEQLALERVFDEHPGVDSLVELMTMALGPGSLLVAARIDLASELDSDAVERVSSELEDQLREAVPEVDHVFLDPTHRREGVRAARLGAVPAPTRR